MMGIVPPVAFDGPPEAFRSVAVLVDGVLVVNTDDVDALNAEVEMLLEADGLMVLVAEERLLEDDEVMALEVEDDAVEEGNMLDEVEIVLVEGQVLMFWQLQPPPGFEPHTVVPDTAQLFHVLEQMVVPSKVNFADEVTSMLISADRAVRFR